MELIDFSGYPSGNITYGGSEYKKSIRVPQGNGTFGEYMLKFRKRTAFCLRNNHICEYLGSHVFELLGFEVQRTFLGTYEGQEVVACQSFLHEGEQFVPFNDVGESTLDRDKDTYQYEYADIMQMLRDNSKLTDVEETVSRFWELFIVDALIGNFDRHGGNWGFIKRDGKYRLAPIFDNGSSLFPNMVNEDEMLAVLDSEQETAKRVYGFPTSQIRLNGRKSSYFDVINSLQFPECNRALCSIVERADLSSILRLADTVPGLGQVSRDFYRHMLSRRFEAILLSSYEKLGVAR